MKLNIVEDGIRSQLDFDRPVISIGRALDNDIRLSDTLVSRHHCRVFFAEGRFYVRDLDSTTGTRVNGERIVERRLFGGETLDVGGIEFRFDVDQTGLT